MLLYGLFDSLEINMKDWLLRFFSKQDGITKVPKRKTFNRSDCEFLGEGSEKRVF